MIKKNEAIEAAEQEAKEKAEQKAQEVAEKADKEKTEKEAQEADGEKQFAKKAEELFARYPQINKIYFAADSTAFFGENDAKNHAKTLNNKTVTPIKK